MGRCKGKTTQNICEDIDDPVHGVVSRAIYQLLISPSSVSGALFLLGFGPLELLLVHEEFDVVGADQNGVVYAKKKFKIDAIEVIF